MTPAMVERLIAHQEQREIALELWAEARRLERMGDEATKGIDPRIDPDEYNRAMSRSSSWYAGSTALERMAWKVLQRSGQSVDADFFEKNKPEG
jgi:hypothetical protein